MALDIDPSIEPKAGVDVADVDVLIGLEKVVELGHVIFGQIDRRRREVGAWLVSAIDYFGDHV
jgi:hypothetical protein